MTFGQAKVAAQGLLCDSRKWSHHLNGFIRQLQMPIGRREAHAASASATEISEKFHPMNAVQY